MGELQKYKEFYDNQYSMGTNPGDKKFDDEFGELEAEVKEDMQDEGILPEEGSPKEPKGEEEEKKADEIMREQAEGVIEKVENG